MEAYVTGRYPRKERPGCRQTILRLLEENSYITLEAISSGQDQKGRHYSPGMRTQANKMLSEHTNADGS